MVQLEDLEVGVPCQQGDRNRLAECSTQRQTCSTDNPDSAGFVADLAYLPFSKGGPSAWPWFNTRIGISYTTYTKLDGVTANVGDNNTVMLYAWTAF